MAIYPTNKYMNPEDIMAMQELAAMDDPTARMEALGGMQRMASGMGQYKAPQERSNGRVVGLNSPMEGLGAMGQQLVGAYMNKQLMDRYGQILDKNNQDRSMAAQRIASRYFPQALRNAQGAVVQSYPVDVQTGSNGAPLDYYGF